MVARSSSVRSASLAGGQSLRLPGSSQQVALHDQLYRYAEDLQHVLERQSSLEENCNTLRSACVKLSESQRLHNEIVGQSPDLHFVTAADGRILQANPAAQTLAPMSQLIGSALKDWVLPACHPDFEALLAHAGERGRSDGQEKELRLRREGPNTTQLIVTASVIVANEDSGSPGYYWVLRDITRIREIQFESQISSMVFKETSEAVMITDIGGEILAVNPAFSRITGYSAEETVGRRPTMLRSGMHDAGFYTSFWRSLQEKGYWQGEIYNRRKSGEIFSEWLTVNTARDANGQTIAYIAVFTDLSRILQAERRLSYLAHHDMLTGLPNRLLFNDRLEQAVAQARRNAGRFTLIFIDLDRFKQINDSLGHEIGDIVLREAAARLAMAVREVDTVARLGGDEFVIIAPELAGPEAIAVVANKVIDIVSQPMQIDGNELFIGASLGCATYPEHGDEEALLLKHADAAMYVAKSLGGNTHVVFDSFDGAPGEALHLETELRHALERGQLRLEYQPQIEAASGRVLGVEALLRWDHPKLGQVPPAHFIPVAERSGLILSIGQWVLQAACAQLAAWDGIGLPPLTMAVNLSPRQLRDPLLVESIRSALARHGIAANRLEMEITESEIMQHLDADRGKLARLRELGVKIAIDDFGTGYSSLARLMNLPIDSLKIDRSFISELEREGCSRAEAITAAVLNMGMALGVQLVAEGVETDAQYALLSGQGCQVIQGFLTGRPMRPEMLSLWLSSKAEARSLAASAQQ